MAQELRTKHKVGFNTDKIADLFGDKIYPTNASAVREQYVNGYSHGCRAYHDQYGYTDDVFLNVEFDHLTRTLIIEDNGMGMTEETFLTVYSSYGYSENTSSKRSGQHGLGAMSHRKISSSTRIESCSKKTGEKFCYTIEDGKDIEEAKVKHLKGHGTRIEIVLKPDVRISELKEMLVKLAIRYPVKTILSEVNTEVSRTAGSAVNSYGRDEIIDDSVKIFNAVRTLEDYIKSIHPDQEIIRLESSDPDVEIWLSNKSHNLDVMLCQVPIKLANSRYELEDDDEEFRTQYTFFDSIINNLGVTIDVKDERRFPPIYHRDNFEPSSARDIIKIAVEAFQKFINDIHFETLDEYKVHRYKSLVDTDKFDEALDDVTRSVMHEARMNIEIREDDNKEYHAELRDILDKKYVFYFSSMKTITIRSFLKSELFDDTIYFIRPSRNDQYYDVVTSRYEDALHVKERLNIKSKPKEKRDIIINVHQHKNTVQYTIDEVDADPHVYSCDNYAAFEVKRKQHRNFDESIIGFITAKTHRKKIRNLVPAAEKYTEILNKQRTILKDGIETQGTINSIINSSMILSDITNLEDHKLVGTKYKIAYVEPYEKQFLEFYPGSKITITDDDPLLGLFVAQENPFTDKEAYDFIRKYGLRKAVVGLNVVTMVRNHMSTNVAKEKIDDMLSVTGELIETIFNDKDRASWCNIDKISRWYSQRLSTKFKTLENSYISYIHKYNEVLRMIKTDDEIIRETMNQIGFDGYKKSKAMITFYRKPVIHTNENLHTLKDIGCDEIKIKTIQGETKMVAEIPTIKVLQAPVTGLNIDNYDFGEDDDNDE